MVSGNCDNNAGSSVVVNGLALWLNTMPATSVLAEIEIAGVLEASNVAVSAGPLGTVLGIQLVAVFQSPLVGFKVHAALPASAIRLVRIRINAGRMRMKMKRVCGWVIVFMFSFQ